MNKREINPRQQVSNDLERLLRKKSDNKTKPPGSLGLLEDIAIQIGLIQNTLNPEIVKPSMLVFAADHGLTDEGISPYPKDVTWQMVMNFCAGGAAINVFCKQNGIGLNVIDVGVDFDFPAGLPIQHSKIARGSRNMRKEPAMSSGDCQKAMNIGAEAVRKRAAEGSNTISFGEMGIGNTSASSLLMHKFTGIPVEECTGRGAGCNNQQVYHKTSVLKEIAEKYEANSPEEILATFGGLEIAAMVGALLEAKQQNMVILVDGFIASAAALTAIKIDASVKDNCIFCHVSGENGHQKMLDYLGARPLLQLNMRLGEGTGAAVALPLVKSAVAFLREMSSMEDAGVSDKH
jgi:nicotinate-nucleotide--dimethylbenzimidazole phosphoribosyltransferase